VDSALTQENIKQAIETARRVWRLPRAVIPIYGTTFVDTLGYTLMIPLLPIVAQRYGASDVMVGALLSIPAFCSMIVAPIWGKLSDRFGRKVVIISGQCLSLAGYLLLALSHSLLLIFLSRVISGCGGGSLGSVASYIADVTKEDQRDEAYAIYGAVFGMAFVVGPVTSGMLAHNGVAIPFFVAAGLEVLNIVFTIRFVPQRRVARATTGLRSFLEAVKAPGVRRVLIRQFLFIFGVVCFLANFALYLQHILRNDAPKAGWLLGLAGLVGGIVLLVGVAPLARLIGRRRVAQIGFLFALAAYVLLLTVNNVFTFFFVLVLWAIGSAMVEPTLTAALSQRADERERGAIMGLGDSINSLAIILGPAAGSAIVGANARLLGILPAVASVAALLMGHED